MAETNKIDRAFAEATGFQEETKYWECRNCGLTFDSGRDARQHMMKEHDNPLGVKRHTDTDN